MKELSGYLTGKFLMASPQMADPRFEHALIYICGHDENGAMGIVVNKPMPNLTFKTLLEQLHLASVSSPINLPIFLGGPVEPTRGFVLHSDDYTHPATMTFGKHISLTSTLDILEAIANGRGPKNCLLALGYAGWSSDKLEQELHDNGWLQFEGEEDLLFEVPVQQKWTEAMKRLGLEIATLSTQMGHS